jgi:hypothetical protein
MPLSFPLTTAQFMQNLRIMDVTFQSPEQLEVNSTAGGARPTARIGPTLWRGEVRIGTLLGAEVPEHEVMIQLLNSPLASFYVFDTRRPGPRQDRNGTVLGAATPGVLSLPNNRELSLAGLPSGYVLKRGDYIAFDYGSAPVRRALHTVVDATVTANGIGQTPLFEVYPPIRPGALASGVTLIRPACKAKMVPGSFVQGNTSQTRNTGMQFRWEQVLT